MMSTRSDRTTTARLDRNGRHSFSTMQFIHHAALRSVMLGLAALLACTSTGCQCCAWNERYMDCVDHICDHEGNAQVLYRPWYDLTRIGRADWPWACCQRCPPPGFVYNTPVTHQVLGRIHLQDQGTDSAPASPAPPPLLPEDNWPPPSDSLLEGDDVGVYPLGPLFEPDASSVPPSPEPIEEAPPAPSVESLPPSSPQPEARRQPVRPREASREASEPTPALPRLPVSSQIDARDTRDTAIHDASGVVRLFDDSSHDAADAGITVHHIDQNEFGPISMDHWLSDQENVERTSGGPTSQPTTAAANAGDLPPWSSSGQHEESTSQTWPAPSTAPTTGEANNRVSPSSAWASPTAVDTAERAHWWDAAPSPTSGRAATVPQPSRQAADDVFGASPFAEWQPAAD